MSRWLQPDHAVPRPSPDALGANRTLAYRLPASPDHGLRGGASSTDARFFTAFLARDAEFAAVHARNLDSVVSHAEPDQTTRRTPTHQSLEN